MKNRIVAWIGLIGVSMCFTLWPLSGDAPATALPPTAITNVTVIDLGSGERLPARTVIVDGTRIVAVGPAGTTRPPAGSRVLDGSGKYLIPGLWDMHVHLSMTGRSALGLFLANGVTGIRDMGGDPGLVLGLRDSIAAGLVVGPRIKAAGIIVESASWLAAVRRIAPQLNRPDLTAELERRFGIATPDDAIRAIDSLVRLKVDFVKIRNYPSPEAYAALARAARARGLKLAGHSPPPEFLGSLSDSGFASLEHSVTGVRNDTLINAFDAMTPAERTDLFRRFAKNGTEYDPTFISSKAQFVPDTVVLRMIADTSGVTRPALKYASARVREAWRTMIALRSVDSRQDWEAIYRSNLKNVRDMSSAGMKILAGTDVPVATLVPGFSLQDELEILVQEAGLTPLEALRAAALNPPTVVGLESELGRVAVGQLADLLLLDRDPLSQIGNVRAVRAVIANGRLLDRSALDRLLTTKDQ